jgi:hypothetical protein
MYSAFLLAHSVLRWFVVFAGLGAVWFGFSGVRRPATRPGPAPATGSSVSARQQDASVPAATRFGLLFTVFFDLQVLLGLTLYLYLSPITRMTMHNMAGVMSNDVLRFWAIEHPVGMLAGLALVHIARVHQRSSNTRKRRRAAVYFAFALAVVLLTIPWPFMPYGRPLLWS